MDGFIKMLGSEQRVYFEEAQSVLGLPPASIEKDFWVCWTLWKLFEMPHWGNCLTFKGGTSLSKAYNLISRFSEDIDIVIGRDFLGFVDERDPRSPMSNKRRKGLIKELKEECQARIHGELKPKLETIFTDAFPEKIDWSLEIASQEIDPDEQTLLFKYPGVFTGSFSYLSPQVPRGTVLSPNVSAVTEVVAIVVVLVRVIQGHSLSAPAPGLNSARMTSR